MSVCAICGEPKENDLFSAATNSPTCSICTQNFMGGLKQTPERVAEVRAALGLADGEYIVQDRLAEARRILGRR